VRLPQPPLLVITDRHQARLPLEEIAEAVFRAGGRWLSLREKDLDPAARRALLAGLVARGRPYGALVMVHEDIEAALAVGAGGVHLPQGIAPALARRRLGRQALIGASMHAGADLAALAGKGALDYGALSPICASASKPGYGPPLGIAGVKAFAACGVPVLALGGIEAGNVGACVSAGAAGIAVMGVVMRAGDPGAVTAGLLRALGNSLAAAPPGSHSRAPGRARASEGG